MKYSIITINYNNADGLRRTIESVVRQTYTDYEYLIIDGGSTDGSVNAIKDYEDKISYWVSEKDGGIYNAMNKGVKVAHGEYLIFMNSGDFFYDSDVLKNISKELYNEDVLVGKVFIYGTNNIISPPPQRELSMYHLFSGSIPHQGTFIKTTIQKKYPFDEALRISSDWKFFLQTIIFDNCNIKFTNIPVAIYDNNGISSNNPSAMRFEKEHILSEYLPQRVILDYKYMKQCECLTQTLTPQLRKSYRVDKLLYLIGKLLLKINNRQ